MNAVGQRAAEQLGHRSPTRFILEIDIGERLAAVIAHDKAGVQFVDRPGRREAVSCHGTVVCGDRNVWQHRRVVLVGAKNVRLQNRQLWTRPRRMYASRGLN
jgi:hypothetical protein